VWDLCEGPDGALWLATGRGIARVEPATLAITTWTSADGLDGGTVTDVLVDDAGFVWAATSSGVTRLDPRIRARAMIQRVQERIGFADPERRRDIHAATDAIEQRIHASFHRLKLLLWHIAFVLHADTPGCRTNLPRLHTRRRSGRSRSERTRSR
jgi:hypothetical protein